MNALLSVKKLLDDSIRKIDVNKQAYVKDPDRDFIRNRKLSFSDTIRLIISMESHTIRSELLDFFSFAEKTITTSAFIQQRDKLKPGLFRSLFHIFTSKLMLDAKDKYRFFAVDGSVVWIPLPGENEKYGYYTKKNQGAFHQLHVSAIYDLESDLYATAYIEPRKGHNERAAFHYMLDEQSFPKNSVFVFDRGYESYHLIAHIQQKNQYYVIRAKDFSVGGILNGLGIPKVDEFDVLYEKTFVSRDYKKYKCDPERYHRVHYSESPYFLNKAVKEYPLAFRVVRFPLGNGSYECLITNLPQDEFNLSRLKQIYGMRWGIETSFRQLKYSVGLLDFHSKKIESIEQEIWARLILYNFSMAVGRLIEKRKTKSQYPCKLNIKNAIQICRKFLKIPVDETPPNMDVLISRELIPVRAGRKAPRKEKYKRPSEFCYRK